MTVLRLSLEISPPSPLQAFLHRCELSLWGPIQRAESISEPLSSGSDSQQLMHIMQFVPTAMLFVRIIPLILASLGPKKTNIFEFDMSLLSAEPYHSVTCIHLDFFLRHNCTWRHLCISSDSVIVSCIHLKTVTRGRNQSLIKEC